MCLLLFHSGEHGLMASPSLNIEVYGVNGATCLLNARRRPRTRRRGAAVVWQSLGRGACALRRVAVRAPRAGRPEVYALPHVPWSMVLE